MFAIIVLVIVVVIIAAMLAHQVTLALSQNQKIGGGGAGKSTHLSPHIVVDTLNLAHWQGRTITPDNIVNTIDETAPTLRAKHSGRIMYVLKDRDSQFNNTEIRKKYKQAAERNQVYVSTAERYEDPPSHSSINGHSSQGRDDFYMSMLANRYRCSILTCDRLRDFDQLRASVPPFHVVEYAFWREAAHNEYVRPSALSFTRMKKPRRIDPSMYFTAQSSSSSSSSSSNSK